jgi:thiamine-monophosphate kinase
MKSRHSGSHGPSAPGEVELLRLIRRRAQGSKTAELRLGIGDDCAILRPRAGEEIVVTTDLSLEGRHFRLDTHPPESVGHRALARGLSDLAAMGARPLAAFLSLAVPPELTVRNQGGKSWTERFYDGLFALAKVHKTPLAGGDLAQFPQVVADITLVGAVRKVRALLRSGALPGDLIYVTGKLGGAAAGLRILNEHDGFQDAVPAELSEILKPHLYPKPRIGQGKWLARYGAWWAALGTCISAMDLSDGLSIDLARLCEESGVAAEIDEAALPIAHGATLDEALHGGEDYELLFTAPADKKLPRKISDVPITRIGRVLPQETRRKSARRPRVTLLTGSGSVPLEPKGWQHFSRQS